MIYVIKFQIVANVTTFVYKTKQKLKQKHPEDLNLSNSRGTMYLYLFAYLPG